MHRIKLHLLSKIFQLGKSAILVQSKIDLLYKKMNHIIFRNVDHVITTLNENKNGQNKGVTELLDIYQKTLEKYQEQKIDRNFQFVVLEGLDGCGKSTTGKKLADRLNAINWCTPPKSIKHLRELFDDHPLLRTAYYALGNYIAGMEVNMLLAQRPVVMDRYWHSTCAYAVAQAIHDGKMSLPQKGDNFYRWPNDLIKPDKIFFLDVDEKTRLDRLSRRKSFTSQENLLKTSADFRKNLVTIYQNMIEPNVIFVDGNRNFGPVLAELSEIIQQN